MSTAPPSRRSFVSSPAARSTHEDAEGRMGTTEDLTQERAALVVVKPEPFSAEAPAEGLRGDITPTALHFVRSNFTLPVHDGRLEIVGAVEREATLTVDDMRGMPAVERAVTMECAGNGRL